MPYPYYIQNCSEHLMMEVDYLSGKLAMKPIFMQSKFIAVDVGYLRVRVRRELIVKVRSFSSQFISF